MASGYKTYHPCAMCQWRWAPAGKNLCPECDRIDRFRSEARARECPICGADIGYACFTQTFVEEMYGGGHWEVKQGPRVHQERHPDYVAPANEELKKPWWRRAWHFSAKRENTV